MTIHYLTPYSVEKNIGKAYNEACALVPDGDWICIRDGDTMFLTPEWGRHVAQVAKVGAGLFNLIGCMTNRLATTSHQIVQGAYHNHDIKYHNKLALNQWALHGPLVKTSRNVLAGHFLLFPKSAWHKTKFEENTIHFDSRFSNAVNSWGTLGLATGLYIYHWYRGDSEYKQPEHDSEHLMK